MSYPSFDFLDHSKPILVFGRDGQLGKALQTCLKDIRVFAVFLGREDCDLSNEIAIKEILNRYQPQVIINAAAYTAVDKAESEGEEHLAFNINEKAPAVMANYVAKVANGILVHFSTDYVFADTKCSAYSEDDPVGPVARLGVYGQSKLAGELAIQDIFYQIHKNGANKIFFDREFYQDKFSRYFILRTSWLYGDGDNFIRTMLRLAREHDQLKVVADQVGVPSSAEWLAKVGIQIAGSRVKSGVYHAVPDGETSWHGLAVFAIKTAARYGEDIKVKLENILSISAKDYPLLAPRPTNSRLSNSKLKKALSNLTFTEQYPNWQGEVESYVKKYVKARLQKN